MGMVIDNGNHLTLSGNAAVETFLSTIGTKQRLAGPAHADFRFADLARGRRWTIRINDGRVPWWILAPGRRVPGTSVADYLPLARLLRGGNTRIDSLVTPEGPLWEQLLRPVLLSALNTAPEAASAALAAQVLRETLGRGGRATLPRIAQPTLAAAFIDPALDWLAERQTPLVTGRRLRALEFSGDRVSGLVWSNGPEAVAEDQAVVLALPASVATTIVPRLKGPDTHNAIVNGHFAFPASAGMPAMLGILGGTAEWIFTHPDRISVTISAADDLIDQDREQLALKLWSDVSLALGIDQVIPPWQIVKERRATFAATPEQDALRPGGRTRWRNLFLAGDWVQNGLPATIEGALRSGENAAQMVLDKPLRYELPRC